MNNKKPTLLKLAAFLAVFFLVTPTWNHHQTVLALSTKEKSCLLDETKYTLVPKDELVTSITDLTDGVYSFELSTVRTGCATSGNGRNGMFTILHGDFMRDVLPAMLLTRLIHCTTCRLLGLQQQDLHDVPGPQGNSRPSDASVEQVKAVV